jgi:hypothetical protein
MIGFVKSLSPRYLALAMFFAEWGGTRTFDAIGPGPANQACPLSALRKRQCSSRKLLSTDVSYGVGEQSSAYFLSLSRI